MLCGIRSLKNIFLLRILACAWGDNFFIAAAVVSPSCTEGLLDVSDFFLLGRLFVYKL